MQLINVDLLEYSSCYCFIILKVNFKGGVAGPAGSLKEISVGFYFYVNVR